MALQAPEFRVALARFVADYEGPAGNSIRAAQHVFDWYARLWAQDQVGRQHRALLATVLAYFVVPDDVLPEEELGPWGLVDDLYLAAHVFRILARELPAEVITAAWDGENEVGDVMARVHAETRTQLGKQARDVLRLAGIA